MSFHNCIMTCIHIFGEEVIRFISLFFMEELGIEPGTSDMLSVRPTAELNPPPAQMFHFSSSSWSHLFHPSSSFLRAVFVFSDC